MRGEGGGGNGLFRAPSDDKSDDNKLMRNACDWGGGGGWDVLSFNSFHIKSIHRFTSGQSFFLSFLVNWRKKIQCMVRKKNRKLHDSMSAHC